MDALHKNHADDEWWSWEKHMLARKPVEHYIYPGCFVNGVKFNSVDRDEGRRTQNSGIMVGQGADVYYGQLVRVVQLLYGNNINVFLFKCKWFKRTNEDLGLISVDTDSSWYENEPFALATFVRQVFYVDDPKAGAGWKVVNHMSHRGIWPAVPTSLEGAATVQSERDNVSAYQEADTASIPPTTNLISFGERLPMPDHETDLTEQDITAMYGNINDEEEAVDDEDDDVVFDDDDPEYDDEDHWSSDNAEVNVDDVDDDDSD